MQERLIEIDGPYDFRSSVSTIRKSGLRAPVARWVGDTLYKATSTPDGPATIALCAAPQGARAQAWGPGAGWVLEHAPRWVGAHDDPTGFEPQHPIVRDMARKHSGLRMAHTGRVFDALQYVIFGQKVTGKGANGSRDAYYRAFGEPAPGPIDLLLPPHPKRLRSVAYFELHPMNVERKRATILLHTARVAHRMEEALAMTLPDAKRRVLAVRGIGVWTWGLAGGAALGDPDAVAIGDYHLKNTIAYALAGEARASDERMMELLAPYAGHQRRVVELIGRSGQKAPRYGARLAVNDIRRR